MPGISNSDFRADLPEFSDITAFQDSTITYWMNLGLLMLNQSRWGVPGEGGTNPRTEFDIGLEMFVAHNVALEAAAINQSTVGGVPGIAQGPIASKGAGDVSISYNSEASIELDAGHWNNTVYGQRFIRLARMYGAGCLQISGGGGGWAGVVTNGFGSGGAWVGPNPLPGWFSS